MQGNPLTWADCYTCAFSNILATPEAKRTCARLGKLPHRELGNCSQPTNGFVDQGLYAAQLAWWLRWFPPDRFLVLSTTELRHPRSAVNVRPSAQLHHCPDKRVPSATKLLGHRRFTVAVP